MHYRFIIITSVLLLMTGCTSGEKIQKSVETIQELQQLSSGALKTTKDSLVKVKEAGEAAAEAAKDTKEEAERRVDLVTTGYEMIREGLGNDK
ncbi:MAG: hypothetical protein O2904_04775 [bacterium]|nr:hypothetical protein [bacterium]